MSYVKQYAVILTVFVACVGCDQATKSIARSVLSESEIHSYLGDTVRLQLVYNKGGFLSMGAALAERWRRGLFIVGAGCLLTGILAFAMLSKRRRISALSAIALVSAGGAGNLYDRIAYDGGVVDFINIGIGPVRTGIFNIADVVILIGLLILIFQAMRREKIERLSGS